MSDITGPARVLTRVLHPPRYLRVSISRVSLCRSPSYGGISQAEAWLEMMRYALRRWPKLDTFATLSETHALIGDPAAVAEFFTRHVGLSFPGRDIQTSASEEHISFLLNDVTFSCDSKLFHVGWRDDPTPPGERPFSLTELFSPPLANRTCLFFFLFSSSHCASSAGPVSVRVHSSRRQPR